MQIAIGQDAMFSINGRHREMGKVFAYWPCTGRVRSITIMTNIGGALIQLDARNVELISPKRK